MSRRAPFIAVRAAGAALILLVASQRIAQAQAADSVYTAAELTTPPKLASATATAHQIQRSYPENLKRAGITGQVQVEFIVDSKGKVEASSVEVVLASVPALGEAAKGAVQEIEFIPGKLNGNPVRTRVLLPISYKQD